MGKLRHREVDGLAQGHTVAKWRGLVVHDILLSEKKHGAR